MNQPNNIINYPIDLNKFKLLGNISPDYLEFILDDIFNQGYNSWVKNFIKQDTNIIFDNNTISDNNITGSKLTSKGQSGENVVLDIIKEKFPDYIVENTSKFSHHGDIQVTSNNNVKIIVEVKNYNKTVDQEQIDKLKFDMKFTDINLAIMISLNSGIVGKKRFEIESFYFGKTFNYILYIPYSMHKFIPNKKYTITHNSLTDSIYNLAIKIEYSLSIIISISENILANKNKQNYLSNKNIDLLIEQFEKFYSEFKIVKYSCIKLEENIKKSLDTHLTVIKDFESGIKTNINNLISKKFNQHVININPNQKIIIKDIPNNSETLLHQEIFIESNLIGKIIKTNNFYDIVVNYQNQIINEFFTDYDECICFLNSIIF